MLSTQSSLFCPPTKFSFAKCHETRRSLLPSPCDRRQESNGSVSLKTGVLYDGYPYFTSPSHPLQSELDKFFQAADDNDDNYDNIGVGITDFFQGKNIFITGATGLLGKVLVEKILRSSPVGKVYVLIKAKDKEDALDRLDKEIIKSDLFECVREKHGETFLREKLIPIVGNICEPNMGMDSRCADDVRQEVDIIVQYAACSTTLNERYDLLIDANVTAPQRLMRFARSCKNLKVFAHISTAYVNGRTEGVISEEPLMMGDNRREQHIGQDLFPRLDVADEINMALKLCTASADYDVTKNLKKLGQERADFFGWHDTHHFTKAMGEMVLDEIRGDVPLVIIRPTIIESSYKEPFPGWIQGNRSMFDPFIISYGKGQLPAFLGNPEAIMDIIPVDMVANTTIAAIAKTGSIQKPQLNVYHVASSVTNPLSYSDFFEYLHEYFSRNPLIESQSSIARIKYFDNIDDFLRYTREETARGAGLDHMSVTTDEGMIRKIQSQCKEQVAYAEQLCKMYEFIGFFKARFDTGNTETLMKEMSREERVEFEVDAKSIDWKHYIQDVHIPGLKKHVFKGTTRTPI